MVRDRLSRPDPRPAALSRYLGRTAASFSLSADVTGSERTAELGMALLDAAQIAEAMPSADPRIRVLSEAGLFESMPDSQAAFVEVPEVRRAVRRLLVAGPQSGSMIIAQLVAIACELAASSAEPRAPLGHEPTDGPRQPRSFLPLDALYEAVGAAREGLQARRADKPGGAERELKRRELVLALQAYVHALESWPLPVPHALRAELHLQQGLLR